jgi:hypothetical protein
MLEIDILNAGSTNHDPQYVHAMQPNPPAQVAVNDSDEQQDPGCQSEPSATIVITPTDFGYWL